MLPQKSHECGFIFILCHKNYRKTTFDSGIPHAKFATTSRCCYADVATTSRRPVQQYAWRHWDSAMTLTQQEIRIPHMLYLIFLYPPRIPRLDRRTPQVKFFLVFTDKLCTEGNISVRMLKWFWRDIFVQISQIRSLYVGNHWSRAWDKVCSSEFSIFTTLFVLNTSVREQCFTRKGIFHVTWLILPYLEHNAYLHQIVYSYGRIDGEVADIPRMLQLSVISGEFPLHYNVDSFCASEILTSILQSFCEYCSRVANFMLRIPILPR
jgi:hypothetical protein